MEPGQTKTHPHFNKWFPRPVPKDGSPNPLMRIFCFHGAVSIPAVKCKICSNVPYVLVGYSMGCWIAYELCCAIDRRRRENTRIRLPERVIVASMVSPTTPVPQRPWRLTATLSAEDFQKELRGWSCNEVLFQPDLWKTYEPMLRNDHKLLDDYVCSLPDKPLSVPCTVFRARGDLKLQNDALFSDWFSLFKNDHRPAPHAGLTGGDRSSHNASDEGEGEKPTKDISREADKLNDGIATLKITDEESSPERNSVHSGNNSADTQKQSAALNVMGTETNPSSSVAGADGGQPERPTVRSSAEQYVDEAASSGIQLLDGNHGLMYDSQHRDQFFKEIEKILEGHMLELTYTGA